jgi:hypothetical protein
MGILAHMLFATLTENHLSPAPLLSTGGEGEIVGVDVTRGGGWSVLADCHQSALPRAIFLDPARGRQYAALRGKI